MNSQTPKNIENPLSIHQLLFIIKTKGLEHMINGLTEPDAELAFECQHGHVWFAHPSQFKYQKWCPSCVAQRLSGTMQVMQFMAAIMDGKCLSTEYNSSITKMKWQCGNGHVWSARPSSISQGKWCPECSGHKKKSIEDMQLMAAGKGGKCLSKKYNSSLTKLKWRCANGHVWSTTPSAISQGKWCPDCGGSKKKTIEDMQQMAKDRNGECLSEAYINTNTKLKWKCSEDHVWFAQPMTVKQGSWCPKCAGRERSIKDMQQLAGNRGGECLSNTYKNSTRKLTWKCAKNHIWSAQPYAVLAGTWCPECAGKLKKSLEDMQQMAIDRGGECLSKDYVNGRTKLDWKCSEGHVWSALPSHIVQGSWCPKCAGTAKKSIEDMQQLAKKRGGVCLSKEYVNQNTKLEWRCSQGHVWSTIPKIIRNGSWCPECSGNKSNHEPKVVVKGNITIYSSTEDYLKSVKNESRQ